MNERQEEVAAFIRERRSNESNFESLCQKLEEELANGGANTAYKSDLEQVKEKAEQYRKAKETGGTAWPEFENFVSGFEKALNQSAKNES